MKSNKGEKGEGGGAEKRGELIKFFPLKMGDLLKRGLLIEDLW